MLRAHELIKQRLCWHMHTHRNSSQPLAMQRLTEFPVFCHFLVKVTVHSAKEMGSNGLDWVRLELPASTYQTPVGRPTPHNTIKTMRRAHQDTKKAKKNRLGTGRLVTWLSGWCQASLITSLLLELYRRPYLCCTRCTHWHGGRIYCCLGHVEQRTLSVALFLCLWVIARR